MTATLLPLEPLRQAAAHSRGVHPDHLRTEDLAEQVGVSDRTWHRWTAQGGLSVWAADRCATRLGQHPCAIWPALCDDSPSWEDAADLLVESAVRSGRIHGRKEVTL